MGGGTEHDASAIGVQHWPINFSKGLGARKKERERRTGHQGEKERRGGGRTEEAAKQAKQGRGPTDKGKPKRPINEQKRVLLLVGEWIDRKDKVQACRPAGGHSGPC